MTLMRMMVATGFALGAVGGAGAQEGCAAPCLAIVDVNVISMAQDSDVEAGATVLIEGERIVAVGAAGEVAVPQGAQIIDGRGKWLIPGLTDMHIHFLSEPIEELDFSPEQILSPYIAHGVLQVADLAASPFSNDIRDAVAAGEMFAPMMATAAMVDGMPAIREGAREIGDPEAAREVVAGIAAQGFDFVKIYSRLDLASFEAVLEAADDEGIGVIGHIPGERSIAVEDAIVPGFDLVAHAEEFGWLSEDKSGGAIEEVVELMTDNGTALTTTLGLGRRILEQTADPSALERFEGLEMLHPIELIMWFEQNPYIARSGPERIAQLEAVADFSERLTLALHRVGVPVMAGTDASFVPGLAPGLSLHEELAVLVEIGFSPREALASATAVPANWLGVIDDRGTVEVGKRANLVLLAADPLAAIENTQAIEGVVFNGEYFGRGELDAMLADLDALYGPYRALSPQAAALFDN